MKSLLFKAIATAVAAGALLASSLVGASPASAQCDPTLPGCGDTSEISNIIVQYRPTGPDVSFG